MNEKNTDSKCLVVFKNKCDDKTESSQNSQADENLKTNIRRTNLFRKPFRPNNNLNKICEQPNKYEYEDTLLRYTRKTLSKIKDICWATTYGAFVGQVIGIKWGGAGGWIVGGICQIFAGLLMPLYGGFYGLCFACSGLSREEFLDLFKHLSVTFGTEGWQQPQRGSLGGFT